MKCFSPFRPCAPCVTLSAKRLQPASLRCGHRKGKGREVTDLMLEVKGVGRVNGPFSIAFAVVCASLCGPARAIVLGRLFMTAGPAESTKWQHRETRGGLGRRCYVHGAMRSRCPAVSRGRDVPATSPTRRARHPFYYIQSSRDLLKTATICATFISEKTEHRLVRWEAGGGRRGCCLRSHGRRQRRRSKGGV